MISYAVIDISDIVIETKYSAVEIALPSHIRLYSDVDHAKIIGATWLGGPQPAVLGQFALADPVKSISLWDIWDALTASEKEALIDSTNLTAKRLLIEIRRDRRISTTTAGTILNGLEALGIITALRNAEIADDFQTMI